MVRSRAGARDAGGGCWCDLPGCRSVADPGHRVRDAGPRRILAHLRDPVLAPFVAVAAIPAMILVTALEMVAFAAGRVAAVIFLAVTIAVGGWLTGQWIVGDLGQSPADPGLAFQALW